MNGFVAKAQCRSGWRASDRVIGLEVKVFRVERAERHCDEERRCDECVDRSAISSPLLTRDLQLVLV